MSRLSDESGSVNRSRTPRRRLVGDRGRPRTARHRAYRRRCHRHPSLIGSSFCLLSPTPNVNLLKFLPAVLKIVEDRLHFGNGEPTTDESELEMIHVAQAGDVQSLVLGRDGKREDRLVSDWSPVAGSFSAASRTPGGTSAGDYRGRRPAPLATYEDAAFRCPRQTLTAPHAAWQSAIDGKNSLPNLGISARAALQRISL